MRLVKLLMAIGILCLVLPTAAAIGIAPAERKIGFEPGLEAVYTGLIINNEGKDLTAKLSVVGPMPEAVSLHQAEIHLGPDEDEKQFEYTVKLPRNLEGAGLLAEIVATEVAEPKTTSGTTISVVSAVKLRIIIVEEGELLTVAATREQPREEAEGAVLKEEEEERLVEGEKIDIGILVIAIIVVGAGISIILQKIQKKRKIHKGKYY